MKGREVHWSNDQVIFLAGFAGKGGINKVPTVWIDGAGPPPKYAFKNNTSLMSSKF
jgi:hypothetical protein